MAVSPRILQLSTELLQHILQQSTAESLPVLRLVCTAFDAVAFSLFAAEYLSQVECYVMDPSRLKRLKKIIATPHMAHYLKKVKLTLDPAESHSYTDLSFVRPQHPRRWGQDCYAPLLQWDELDGYIRSQFLYFNEIGLDASLLSSILQDLYALPCTVEICLQQPGRRINEEFTEDFLMLRSPRVAQDLVRTVYRSGYQRIHLNSDNLPILNPTFGAELGSSSSSSSPSCWTHNLGASLRAFRRELTTSDVYAHLTTSEIGATIPGQAEDQQAVREALAHATRLERLALLQTRRGGRIDIDPFVPSLLAFVSTDCLQCLELEDLPVQLNDLLDVLRRNRHTLSEVWLFGLKLLEQGEEEEEGQRQWTTVFQALLDLPRLQSLTLGHLSSPANTFVLRLFDLQDRERDVVVDAYGRRACQQLLLLNVDPDKLEFFDIDADGNSLGF